MSKWLRGVAWLPLIVVYLGCAIFANLAIVALGAIALVLQSLARKDRSR